MLFVFLVSGFLKTGGRGSAQGNFGLLDLVAGLHWLRENLSVFGGDPEKVTLVGHDTGAALVNVVAASPLAKGSSHHFHFKNDTRKFERLPARSLPYSIVAPLNDE